MSLEKKQFIATDTDIEKLAASVIDADQTASENRGRYLKALVATTQRELGAEPRQRNGNGPRLNAEAVAAHLKAFQAVSDRFYAACVKVAQATVPDPDKALTRRRTAFARSASSTVRGYIRGGNDITLLAAHKATKAALATPVLRRKSSVDSMKKRAVRMAGDIEALARKLHAANREAARETFGPLLAHLSKIAGASASTEGARRAA